jgi:hypothetical protein
VLGTRINHSTESLWDGILVRIPIHTLSERSESKNLAFAPASPTTCDQRPTTNDTTLVIPSERSELRDLAFAVAFEF